MVKKNKHKRRVLGWCGFCGKDVYDIGHRDFLNRWIPNYKLFNGKYYHNSKSKPCWDKFHESEHRVSDFETNIELSHPLSPVKANIKRRKRY